MNNDLSRALRALANRQQQLDSKLNMLMSGDVPRTPQEEIDALPGRRIFYTLSGRQNFTLAQLGQRADPINLTVSMDGPFCATHYPVVMWRPNTPDNATNLGRWSPVMSYPLPDQQLANMDIIDIGYEFFDGGSQRAFNNEEVPPIVSNPRDMVKLPQPTLFAPNSVLAFYPTYSAINYSAAPAILTEGGELVVAIPGYRIVNS